MAAITELVGEAKTGWSPPAWYQRKAASRT
jgi:hypothetical protein